MHASIYACPFIQEDEDDDDDRLFQPFYLQHLDHLHCQTGNLASPIDFKKLNFK